MFKELETYANFSKEKRNAFESTVKALMKAGDFTEKEAVKIIMDWVIKAYERNARKNQE